MARHLVLFGDRPPSLLSSDTRSHAPFFPISAAAWPARAAIVLIVGMLGFGFFAGIGVLSGDATAMGILGLIGTLAIVFMSIIAIPSILAGAGLLQRRQWGRILALVVGILSLIDIPIGTALGVYTLWALMNDDIKTAFAGSNIKPLSVRQATTT